MSGFDLQRLGLIMEAEPGNPMEVEGVLNPAAARGPDGALYLFPRLVARGNYSRIGVVRVRFDDAGNPCGVKRLGIALEPEEDYELRPDGGGCEDPRVTFVAPMKRYVMTYTAFGPNGPRIALAVSVDLIHWTRLGLASFAPYQGIQFENVDDKDASLFPVEIPNPAGHPHLAILHRPLFPGSLPEETVRSPRGRAVDHHRESIWISYASISRLSSGEPHPGHFYSHHRLAAPMWPWECLKIGGGTPPVFTRLGWLIVFHGVCGVPGPREQGPHFCYSAGVMVLSKEHPRKILYRSEEPVLTPSLPEERHGVVSNVVFPTGIDRRDDIGKPDRYDVYYGMADRRIGAATFDLPATLPES
jgi:predicted GH43/DUF377 family glycosyl hydrolase